MARMSGNLLESTIAKHGFFGVQLALLHNVKGKHEKLSRIVKQTAANSSPVRNVLLRKSTTSYDA